MIGTLTVAFAGVFLTLSDAAPVVAAGRDFQTTVVLDKPVFPRVAAHLRKLWSGQETEVSDGIARWGYVLSKTLPTTWVMSVTNKDDTQLLEKVRIDPVKATGKMSPYSFRMDLSRLQFEKALDTKYEIQYSIPFSIGEDESLRDVPPKDFQLQIEHQSATGVSTLMVDVQQHKHDTVGGRLSLHFDNGNLVFTHTPVGGTPVCEPLGDGRVTDISIVIHQMRFITKVTRKQLSLRMPSIEKHVASLTVELDNSQQQLGAVKQDVADFKRLLEENEEEYTALDARNQQLTQELAQEKQNLASEKAAVQSSQQQLAAEVSKSSALNNSLSAEQQKTGSLTTQLGTETAAVSALSAQLATAKQNAASSKQQLAAEKQATTELTLERSQLQHDLAVEKETAAALAVDLQSEEQRRVETEKAKRFWFVAGIVSGSALLLTAALCALLCVKLPKFREQKAIASQCEGLDEGCGAERTVPRAEGCECRADHSQVEVLRMTAINHATDVELFPRRAAVEAMEYEDGDSEEMYEVGPVPDTCTAKTAQSEL